MLLLTVFPTLDLVIFCGYLLVMIGLGFWLSRNSRQQSARDYFLAGKALPWWAVGGSLIASNISAEQFIGMSGSGYVVGLAIASYEWMAALTLLVVAKFFLPVFLRQGITTMPQFLERRYDHRVRVGLAVFWVLLFVFVNITSVLYLGGLALQRIMDLPLWVGVAGLVLYAASFSIFGGLRVVVWTDVIQVVVLMFGGLLASVLVLEGLGGGVLAGLQTLLETAPEKFDMILDADHPEYPNLPGLSVLIGGMWIANLYYWGNNQYIIQRALAARDLRQAQLGTAFAAFLKLLLPLIVVIPGIAAFVLGADIQKADEAYPWVLGNYVTVGFKGLAFAALIAAIGSSLSSMVNSTATIFTLDIYPRFRSKSAASDQHLVRVGKWTAGTALLVGAGLAPLLENLDQAFQFIQEYTGFISPGVVAVFLLGLFWKRASANAALAAVILSIPLSMGFKFGFPAMPFLDRMGLVFVVSILLMVIISVRENPDRDRHGMEHPRGAFHTGVVFNALAIAIMMILAALYAAFW